MSSSASSSTAPTATSLRQLGDALAAGALSAEELARAYLARIEQAGALNAFVHVDAELTLAQARAADARRARGEAGPLTGIPIAHKDVFVTRDWRSTAASRMLADYVSPFDATVVARLGRRWHGHAGQDQYGRVRHGLVQRELAFRSRAQPVGPGARAGRLVGRLRGRGGGQPRARRHRHRHRPRSIRQPASFSGITGIKPTYGRVSRFGMIAFASSLDQAGPMARSAEDCALLLNAMAGFDERDSTSLTPDQGGVDEDFTRLLGQPRGGATAGRPLEGLRIGLPKEYFGAGLSADVESAVRGALAEYEKLGATLVEVSLPKTELSIPVYYVIAPAEASSNLSRFDGARYGHRAAEYRDLLDMYKKTRAEGFGWEVKRRILVGTYVLSHGYYDAYYLQAQKIRRIIADDFQRAFGQCDVIMGPVAPTVAWKLGEKSADPVQMYLEDIFTLSTSLAGLPGMSVPCGFGEGGMPVGLQMIGNYFSEAQLLQTAHAFQQATDWHLRQPQGAAQSV
ncbi:aspartyl/glutamyl-tRNA(Asn/Gln) amidotransferase subunit A [Cupriavidus gilardii J11]|uniref:Glutamyl-tRNA(Gln) amidotransferase subunit A n=1 Tax=Cupriavidus gilardii J11 TaxID=936133 RepID=A0A562BJM6_9BURK|nr:aspartyl/glutamyl-tRNA(Asn/Gln) amidotransferase subunit A [Cupriavidus gilardii J11]